MHSADDLVMCLGDFNGHVGRYVDGFNGIRGGYGTPYPYHLEGKMLLQFLFGKVIVCEIHGLGERKRGR